VCAAVVGGRDCPEPLLTCTKDEYFSVESSVLDPEFFRKGGSESENHHQVPVPRNYLEEIVQFWLTRNDLIETLKFQLLLSILYDHKHLLTTSVQTSKQNLEYLTKMRNKTFKIRHIFWEIYYFAAQYFEVLDPFEFFQSVPKICTEYTDSLKQCSGSTLLLKSGSSLKKVKVIEPDLRGEKLKNLETRFRYMSYTV
jgi:hypothetical protein